MSKRLEIEFNKELTNISNLVFDATNVDLAVQNESVETLVKDGWVKNKVIKFLKKNNFSYKEINDYFEHHCKDLDLNDLTLIDLQICEDIKTAGDAISGFKLGFIEQKLNLDLVNHLSIIKQKIN